MRVLVANRGEIAIRLLQALEELGIESVAVHTAVDRLHVSAATEVVEISNASSYMDGALLIQIAQQTRCNAIVPGYGFLSESHTFAASCKDSDIIFVGPSVKALKELGDKSSAKKIAELLGVPILPYQDVTSTSDIAAFANRVGFPIMIKAQDGGGGKGIRIVRSADEIAASLQEAQNESPSRQVFVEKAALENYKHIEIQVIGDHFGNVNTLFERECSLQRNFQKIIEIAPSSLPRSRIDLLAEASCKIAKHIGYIGLGTFEYLVDAQGDDYYFMECNPRIQVEHTITEQVTNLDLVHLLFQTTLKRLDLNTVALPKVPQGCSIQCRINAEDPQTFIPTQGPISTVKLPAGRGIRVDSILSGLEFGASYVATDEYDTLLAKVITTSATYEETLNRAIYALKGFHCPDFKTNQSLLLGIVTSELMTRPDTIDIRSLSQEGAVPAMTEAGTRLVSRYVETSATRKNAGHSAMTNVIAAGQVSASALFKKGDTYAYTMKDGTAESTSKELKIVKILKNNFPEHLSADVTLNGENMTVRIEKSTGVSKHKKADVSDSSQIALPFAGVLIEVLVDPGDEVEEAQTVAIFRQGKMELDVRAPYHGTIVEVVPLVEGEPVGIGALIAVIAPTAGSSGTPKL